MWELKKYPILRPILPQPTPGIQTGFGFPICPRNEKHPLEYVNVHRSNNNELIGLRCSTFKNASHFFQTPYKKHILAQVQLHNKKAKNPASLSNLLNSEADSQLNTDEESSLGKCKGVNGLYASGHRETCLKRCPNKLCQQCCRHRAVQVCPHHQNRGSEALKPPTPSNPTSSSAFQSTASDRLLAPLPTRRAVNRPTQCAQADRVILKDLSQDALVHYNIERRRTQNEKDGICTKNLKLRVWLKAGEGFVIGAQATDFPRFALIESKPLHDSALNELKDQWDTQLEILQEDSMEWILSDASLSYTYRRSTTDLLVKVSGLREIDCIGLEKELQKIKEAHSSKPPIRTQASSLDLSSYLSMDGPMGVWGHKKMTTGTSSDESDSSEIEVVSSNVHRKRKLTNQTETASSQKKPCLNTRTWPSKTCKLSELILWCDKAPKGCSSKVPKSTWFEIFGDRFNPDKEFKTPYRYQTWVLKKKSDLVEWMTDRPNATIDEDKNKFIKSFREVASLRKGTCANPVIVE
ncbi:uncharacterized protein MELLADRAFT_106075 [Melampsora larici-populina 98AG31]|uniref:Uncharacterized protein n=1 Tax=Melampsora larici-populina (strain 98AG31 / pathotype 3-4-7) TaxID=747676 RepID=F4RKA8_MELLP|nr:uncharacterized protein MELLADRAFT_106075 [Melampsora larici-populina 98AG31]EGG07212.1 hypothetical protein MELLADRAFT_106075 [Melampsora larici-populina 98AG31]